MSIRHLHDDMLLHMSKFVSARDCLSLALSGANERFSILYGSNRRELSLSECYFLLNKPWKRYFKQYIFPSSITVCDMSHCYWLKAKVLLRFITKMENLEELSIQDTRMSLKKMPQVFEACKKIVKLSMTLNEDNLDEFKKGAMEKDSLKCLKKGWCKHCIDLLINITYKEITDSSSQDSDAYNQDLEDLEQFNKGLKEKLLPHLTWMRKLKNLVILIDSHSQRHVEDYFSEVFIFDWHREIGTDSLERLVFPPGRVDDDLYESTLVGAMRGPIVKSVLTNFVDWSYYHYLQDELDDDKYRQLEHLSEIRFDDVENGLEHLLHLKYVCGQCSEDTQGLNDFCERHPKLEQLHFSLQNYHEEEEHLYELGNWKLLLLKVLVYSCQKLSQNAMDHLLENCPNIEQFHIDFTHCISRTETINLFSTIQFPNLKWLTINGDGLLNGSYLLPIVKNCPKLERLHLDGSFEAETFFLHLAECFPFAHNLRDLRVQWPESQSDLSTVPVFLKALKVCPYFERLALVIKDYRRKPSSTVNYTPLQDAIFPFVKETLNLVALCLVGLPIDPYPFVVKQKLIKEIVPSRPAFWFYFGSELPIPSDLSVPRIHFNGIVDPIRPYKAPPCF